MTKTVDDGKAEKDEKCKDAAVDIQWELSLEPGKPDSTGAIASDDLEGGTAPVVGAGDSDLTPTTDVHSSVAMNESLYDLYGKFLQACRWFDVNEDKFLQPDHLRLILQSNSK